MDQNEKLALQKIACKTRMGAIIGTFHAKSGHPGGSLSSAEIFTYLYFKEMNVFPKDSKNPNRDRFVLSKGHCCPGLYAVLAQKGYFAFEELERLRHIGAILQGHPDMKGTPGIDMSTGSLGQGVSAACGMAKNAKMDGLDYRVYALCGDGECEEGQVWESAMFAAHHNLDNLCYIIDCNGLQIDGTVAEIGGIEPLDKKFEGFGFEVIKIDGHNFDEIEEAFKKAKQIKGKPTVIIAKTVKGKGVSFMEDKVDWHGVAPNKEQFETAMAELNAQMAALEGGNA
ncbi:MAG: transketolase [Bacillota bacterium]|nr:transketolase [Bacillota bacterium]